MRKLKIERIKHSGEFIFLCRIKDFFESPNQLQRFPCQNVFFVKNYLLTVVIVWHHATHIISIFSSTQVHNLFVLVWPAYIYQKKDEAPLQERSMYCRSPVSPKWHQFSHSNSKRNSPKSFQFYSEFYFSKIPQISTQSMQKSIIVAAWNRQRPF